MSTKERPLISIIIPVRNGSKYIKEAVESIQKQDIPEIVEIIVIDDGSTDDSGAIAKELGCLVITILTSGAIKARNTGLEASRGEFVLFHDADDILENNSLSVLYNELKGDEQLQAVFAKRRDFISPELTDEEKKAITLNTEPYSGAIAGCALIRRKVFELTGVFDENLQIGGDAIAWQMKIQELGIKTKTILYIAVNRRLHNTNLGRTSKGKEFEDYAAILRQKLRRK